MENKIELDAFGHPVEKTHLSVQCDNRILLQYGLELNKETGNTDVVVVGQVDLVELTQSYKDQAGMEWAMQQIRRGLASPNDFADDGKHSVDASYPTDINTLNEQATAASGAALIKALGITSDMSSEEITAAIVKAVASASTTATADAKAEEVKQ